MTKKNWLTQEIDSTALGRLMLFGAGIGLILITLFLYSAGEPNHAWPKNWMVRPLIVVPVAGAMGAVFYNFMGNLRLQKGWVKVLAYLISIGGFIIALWMGMILWLDGTMWN